MAYNFEEAIDALIPVYQAGVDALINKLGMDCTIYNPSRDVDCPNCVYNAATKRSANIYQAGGPRPFQNGQICPYCNGAGIQKVVSTDSVRMIVIWNPKDWIKIPSMASMDWNSPESYAQTWGYITDLPKIQRAESVLITNATQQFNNYKFIRHGEPCPQGLQENRYFVMMWKRSG